MKNSIQQSPTLKLAYDFTSDPSLIIASTPDETPNQVTLMVVITPNSYEENIISQIRIGIPVGDDSPSALSTNPDLPTPRLTSHEEESVKNWEITASGAYIYIKSTDGTPIEFNNESIIFYLDAITVNDIPGIVLIEIMEGAPSGTTYTDTSTFSLTKYESTCLAGNFRANPSSLNNESATTLYWDCTEKGKDYVYRVWADNWHPYDQPDTDQPYTWEKGETGVVTPVLTETTTFYLDIMQTTSLGGYEIVETQEVRVPVILVVFYETPTYVKADGLQRLIRLYWAVSNASHCSIEVNGKTVVPYAPTKTDSVLGYPVFIGENDSGKTTTEASISVTAYPAEGQGAPTVFHIPNTLDVSSTVAHPMTYKVPPINTSGTTHSGAYKSESNTFGIWLTPSNKALVFGVDPTIVKYNTKSNHAGYVDLDGFTGAINEVDLTTFSCTSFLIGEALAYCRLSNIVASSSHAFTMINGYLVNSSKFKEYTTKVSLADNTVSCTNNALGQLGLSITADEKFLIAALSPESAYQSNVFSGVSSYNIETGESKLLSTGQNTPIYTAITADNKYALVANKGSNTVSIIDISQLSAGGAMSVAGTIPVGNAPVFITVFPDDARYALVANARGKSVSIINIESQTVESTIQTLDIPLSLALYTHSNGNRYAYVGGQSGTLSMIDITNWAPIPGTLSLGASIVATVLTADKTTLYMTQANKVNLTQLST